MNDLRVEGLGDEGSLVGHVAWLRFNTPAGHDDLDLGPALCGIMREHEAVGVAGHLDVVPPGEGWTDGPFQPVVRGDLLYGRGAVDMKGAVAAFIAAAARSPDSAPLALILTGDEEGPATHGTLPLIGRLEQSGRVPDLILVGEPTSDARLGDTIKIGRRGSVNIWVEVPGRQGHVAYPQRADNPVHRLLRALAALTAAPVDAGSDWFEPSTLQVTSIDVGNPATNVIPASARAMLNIRFNDHHSGASLIAWLRATVAQHAERFELEPSISGESFVTRPGPMVEILQRAIVDATGVTPKLDTGGGTSDARFITHYCPVVEFGLVGQTMHQVDERVPIADLRALTVIYRKILDNYFA